MSRFVVDASAGVKWFLPELGSADALRLQQPIHELHVPAFFELELANIFWKRVRQGVITRTEADSFLSQLSALSIPRHPEGPLIATAFNIAHQADRTMYDSLYVALAIDIDAVLVTADDRLVNALASTPWSSRVMKLASLP